MTFSNGQWDAEVQLGDKQWFGFLYLVANVKTGKAYLGRKAYWRGGRKTVVKNGCRIPNPALGKTTSWRTYKTSCKHLLAEIKAKPKDFKFFALAEFANKTDLHYWEAALIFEYQCLLTPAYYNNHCPEIYVLPAQQDDRWRHDAHDLIRYWRVKFDKEVNDGGTIL